MAFINEKDGDTEELEIEDDEYLDMKDAIEIIDLPSNDDRMDEDDYEDDNEATAAVDAISTLQIAEDGVEITTARVFQKHTEPVHKCSVSACGSIVVTGGEDDLAYIWRTYTGEEMIKCTGHKDSVSYVDISHDSQLVATADMAGLVQVWRIRTSEVVFNFDIGGDINWLQWHPLSHILLCGAESGDLWVWLVPRQSTKTLPGHDSSFECGAVTPDGKRVVAGYGDGSVRVHDIKQEASRTVDQYSKHSKEVTCVACHSGNVVAVSGAADGTVRIFNVNTSKVLDTVDLNRLDSRSSSSSANNESVEAVGFCAGNNYLAVFAGGHGTIVVYDISKQSVRHRIQQPDGATQLCFPPHSSSVFVGGRGGSIREYNILSGSLITRLIGHSDDILDLSIDKSGRILVSASDDHTARVFSVGSGDPCTADGASTL